MTAGASRSPSPPSTTAMARLAAALERENTALAALDFAAVGPLLVEKEAALAALSAALTRSPVPIETIRALAAVAARNRALLEHAIAVQGRVIALLARAARPAPDCGYRAPGRRALPERTPPRTLCARA
ncbi:MAG: hypothetical protein ACREFY_04680 [Acetobacteraceae bacterium]